MQTWQMTLTFVNESRDICKCHPLRWSIFLSFCQVVALSAKFLFFCQVCGVSANFGTNSSEFLPSFWLFLPSSWLRVGKKLLTWTSLQVSANSMNSIVGMCNDSKLEKRSSWQSMASLAERPRTWQKQTEKAEMGGAPCTERYQGIYPATSTS